MIGSIAAHEWRRLHNSLLFWLSLAFGQLIIAWLSFAQLEAFAAIAPQLKAGASVLGAMDLVVAPSFNSIVLLLLLSCPLLAMGSIAGETHSGRIALWLSAPLGVSRIVLGKLLGLWLACLPLLATTTLTLALLGLGIQMDWPRFALAVAGLLLISLWLCSISLLMSALLGHPAAALAAAYGLLLFLWLLDSFGDGSAIWQGLALLPHVKPWFLGLLRSQDLVFFLSGAGTAALLSIFVLARRRGEV